MIYLLFLQLHEKKRINKIIAIFSILKNIVEEISTWDIELVKVTFLIYFISVMIKIQQ